MRHRDGRCQLDDRAARPISRLRPSVRPNTTLLYVDGPRLRGDRRTVAGRALRLGRAATASSATRRELRQRDLRRRVQQVVQLAPLVPRPADAPEGRPEGRGAAVPVFRTVTGGFPGDDARRTGSERQARRRRPLRDLPQDRSCPGLPARARHPHAQPLRLPGDRGAARPARGHRRRRPPLRPGIYVTLAAYPLVPKNEVGFRIR